MFSKKKKFYITTSIPYTNAKPHIGFALEIIQAELSERYRELTKTLNISNDDFIRTTDEKKHLPSVYKLWQEYKARGDIYKKKYKGFYCVGCEAFKTEKELVGKKCIIHQKEAEIIEEENYFFKLTRYLPKVKELIAKDKIKIIPETKKNEILNMIN